MQNYYLTDHTNSVDHLSRAFETIFVGSKFETKQVNSNFKSKSDGIITDDFFLGNQLLTNIGSIKISEFNHFVLTLPKQGHFVTHFAKTSVNNTRGRSGCLVLPTDKVVYNKPTEFIDDYLVACNFQDILIALERKFGLRKAENRIFQLDYNHEKVKALYGYVESTLQLVRSFPGLVIHCLLK